MSEPARSHVTSLVGEAAGTATDPETGTGVKIPSNGFKYKSFIQALNDIVHDEQNLPIIGFNKLGDVVEIRSTARLTAEILPMYFRHSRLSSFYRQLNSYGFRTVRSGSPDAVHSFYNAFFKRGNAHLIESIERKSFRKRVPGTNTELREDSILASISSSIMSKMYDRKSCNRGRVNEREHIRPLVKSRLATNGAYAHEDSLRKSLESQLHSTICKFHEERDAFMKQINDLVEMYSSILHDSFGTEVSETFLYQARLITQCSEFVTPAMSSGAPINYQVRSSKYSKDILLSAVLSAESPDDDWINNFANSLPQAELAELENILSSFTGNEVKWIL